MPPPSAINCHFDRSGPASRRRVEASRGGEVYRFLGSVALCATTLEMTHKNVIAMVAVLYIDLQDRL